MESSPKLRDFRLRVVDITTGKGVWIPGISRWETLSDMLLEISLILGSSVKRCFIATGAEVDSLSDLQDSDTLLYLSNTDYFTPPLIQDDILSNDAPAATLVWKSADGAVGTSVLLVEDLPLEYLIELYYPHLLPYAKRFYNEIGAEIDDSAEVFPGDVLYCTGGEPFETAWSEILQDLKQPEASCAPSTQSLSLRPAFQLDPSRGNEIIYKTDTYIVRANGEMEIIGDISEDLTLESLPWYREAMKMSEDFAAIKATQLEEDEKLARALQAILDEEYASEAKETVPEKKREISIEEIREKEREEYQKLLSRFLSQYKTPEPAVNQPKKPLRDDSTAREVEKKPLRDDSTAREVENVLQSIPNALRNHLRRIAERIMEAFPAGHHIRLTSILNMTVLDRFMRKWDELKKRERNVAPVLAFHGTAAANFQSIQRLGLCVPGEHGVVVRHGSALGLGIYTALHPHISMAYSPQPQMLAVAVLLGRANVGGSARNQDYDSNVSVDGSIMVLYTSAQVLPLFIVDYSERNDAPAPPRRPPVVKNQSSQWRGGNPNTRSSFRPVKLKKKW